MKVLNINKFHYMRGGVERYYFALTKLLEDNGHDVIHFSMKDKRNFPSRFSKYFVDNVELDRPGLKMLGQLKRPIWYKQAKTNIERLIDDYKPDIAHIHMLYHHLSPSILPALKNRCIPIVMTLHDYKLICPNYLLFTENDVCKRCKGHKYYNAVIHRCLKDSYAVSAFGALEMTIHKVMQIYEKHVDVMIAPSKFVRDVFIQFGQDPKKIAVIPHFVDPMFLKESKPIKAAESKDEYMLFFGRLAIEKGVDKILEMMYIYKPDLRLKIAGSGPMEAALKAYVEKHCLQDRVEFLGHLDSDDLMAAIKGAELVIMPSRFYEPFGFSALETMALGTPIVASKSGALADIIPDEAGLVFKRDDLKAMYRAVEKAREFDREKLAKHNKKLIEKKYTPDIHYESLKTVYDHLT